MKLIRPEFKALVDDEKKILGLVNEMADLLEGVAVNPYHTPGTFDSIVCPTCLQQNPTVPLSTPAALYSTFLRALVSSKNRVASRAASAAPENGLNAHGNDVFMGDASNSNNNNSVTTNELQVTDLGGGSVDRGGSGGLLAGSAYNAYQHFNFGETGQAQVQDMSTFPPTFASPTDPNEMNNMFSMDNIIGNGFWDSVLIPGELRRMVPTHNGSDAQRASISLGYSNAFEGLSGGFAYGPGGSGFITPKLNSPDASGANSPSRANLMAFSQPNMNGAFGAS